MDGRNVEKRDLIHMILHEERLQPDAVVMVETDIMIYRRSTCQRGLLPLPSSMAMVRKKNWPMPM
ncbi:MAG: hypothetical protein IPF79_06170 [Ignavibacteria bacterium]|nr:hypothetical protein [Ignavibacteria bacterium]